MSAAVDEDGALASRLLASIPYEAPRAPEVPGLLELFDQSWPNRSASSENSRETYFAPDGHCNDAGYAVMAERLASHLVDSASESDGVFLRARGGSRPCRLAGQCSRPCQRDDPYDGGLWIRFDVWGPSKGIAELCRRNVSWRRSRD